MKLSVFNGAKGLCADAYGFSLHAATTARPNDPWDGCT
jgi:hypothetical protein